MFDPYTPSGAACGDVGARCFGDARGRRASWPRCRLHGDLVRAGPRDAHLPKFAPAEVRSCRVGRGGQERLELVGRQIRGASEGPIVVVDVEEVASGQANVDDPVEGEARRPMEAAWIWVSDPSAATLCTLTGRAPCPRPRQRLGRQAEVFEDRARLVSDSALVPRRCYSAAGRTRSPTRETWSGATPDAAMKRRASSLSP